MSKGRDGKAGRLGDDTRARINDLKGGWKLPSAASDETPAPVADVDPMEELPTVEVSDEQRVKRAEAAARAEIAQARAKSKAAKVAPADVAEAGKRATPPKAPLPKLPTPKPKRATVPPPPPVRATAKNSQPPPLPPGAASGPVKAITRAESASQPPPAPRPASAKPGLPMPAVVSPEGSDDDAPTQIASRDEPLAPVPAPAQGVGGNATGTVRLPDSLPRESGFFGDIGYFMRVLAKRRSAKTEMQAIGVRIASEKEARQTKLLDYARQAVGDDSFDQTLVGRARASLLSIEEKRSLHAGRIASANEKSAALERQRSDVKAQRDKEIADLELEIEAVAKSLEPLVNRASDARKRTTQLRLQLSALDEQILKKEASLVAVQGQADKASVHAEVASLRAERAAVASDEPAIAAEVDDLEPKIASLTSSKTELGEKIAELVAEEELDIVRAAEKAEAVKASRVVEERAVSDQAAKQEKQLLELGEGLHNDPPDSRDPKAVAIMRHDVEIGTLERRSLELTELLGSVERAPMIRGGLYLGVIATVPLAAAAYLLMFS